MPDAHHRGGIAMHTLQQKYASAVYKKVNAYEKKDDSDKYGAMALKLPILIHTAGLAQALAFVQSRDKKPFTALLEDLAQVVSGESAEIFVANSRTSELQEYIYLTKQTMIALDWFKRYAQSILKVETTDSAEG
jgi:CRISPR-associated protein Cmr5